MLTGAMKAIGSAIESLAGEPDLQDMVRRLQEMHGELSVRLARGVQGEMFPSGQLRLQEEPPELDAFEFEPAQTC